MQLFLFPNVHKVMKAEKICQAKGIKSRVIPVPEHISSECGMCVLVDAKDVEKCSALFVENNIPFEMHDEELS
ncbi:DUF3343 domain-containing protein [Thermophagus sp. OGC60D27]|uniref:DUF3343 domain-containing protein n=1 Tax=Thermophagus sp. OGC60D27 TaxID=3458415 RepID=UPI004037FD10